MIQHTAHYALTITSLRTTYVTLVRAGSRAVIYVILQNASYAIQVTFWKMVHVILALQDSRTQSRVIRMLFSHV